MYGYDGFGNLTSKSGSGGSLNSAPSMSVSYNANNQQTSGVGYDANGNTNSAGGYSYGYTVVGESLYFKNAGVERSVRGDRPAGKCATICRGGTAT
jgi:hypothetical protein